jgi:hypothetical protein
MRLAGAYAHSISTVTAATAAASIPKHAPRRQAAGLLLLYHNLAHSPCAAVDAATASQVLPVPVHIRHEVNLGACSLLTECLKSVINLKALTSIMSSVAGHAMALGRRKITALESKHQAQWQKWREMKPCEAVQGEDAHLLQASSRGI